MSPFWTDKTISRTKEILAESATVTEAADRLQRECQRRISPAAIKHEFARRKILAPSTFLAKYTPQPFTPAPKPVQVKIPSGTIPASRPEERTEAIADLPSTLICDGDLHYPIHDPYVEAAKLKFAQDLKPDAWVNVGDCYDFWPLSTHEKEPHRWFEGKGRLQEEFDSAQPYWREVRRVTRGSVDFILGNHENRLYRLIGANLGLFKLDAFEWESMAGLPSGVNVRRYKTQLRVGPLMFEHGDSFGGKFGLKHPSGWLLDNKGNRNTIFGHHHRFEVKHRTIFDEHGEPHTYMAMAQGHGSDIKQQTWSYEPNWQQSFTVVNFWRDGAKTRFSAHPILIIGGKFSWGGRVYDGRKA